MWLLNVEGVPRGASRIQYSAAEPRPAEDRGVACAAGHCPARVPASVSTWSGRSIGSDAFGAQHGFPAPLFGRDADSAEGRRQAGVMPACASAADTSGRTLASRSTADVASTVTFGTCPEAKKANHSRSAISGWPCSTESPSLASHCRTPPVTPGAAPDTPRWRSNLQAGRHLPAAHTRIAGSPRPPASGTARHRAGRRRRRR